MATYFADGITNIAVQGNLVRIEYFNQVMPKASQEGIKTEPSHHLVLPLEGFLNGLMMQEQIRQQLLQEGIIKAQEKTPESTH